MDFTFSEEQEAVAEASSAIFAGHATAERVAAVEAGESHFDRELWGELVGANLVGLAVPEEHGGAGLGMVELAIALVEQGRRVAPVPLLPTGLGAMAVAAFGTPEQRAGLLPGVATGGTVLGVAFATGGAGDPADTPVTAVAAGDNWVLDGVLPVVRGATLAAHLLVPARLGPSGGTRQAGVFLVDTTDPACTVTRIATTDRQEHGRVTLAACRAERLGGREGNPPGVDILTWIAERYTVGLCALQLGVCQEAVALAARYVTERRQFGKPLASFQGVALRAADAHIDTEAMSVTLWQAAWLLDQGRFSGAGPAERPGGISVAGPAERPGRPAGSPVAVAKWWASEGGHRVIHAVQHLHGGLGADVTYPVHRYFLWGKHIELEMGAGASQLARLGGELVRQGAGDHLEGAA